MASKKENTNNIHNAEIKAMNMWEHKQLRIIQRYSFDWKNYIF